MKNHLTNQRAWLFTTILLVIVALASAQTDNIAVQGFDKDTGTPIVADTGDTIAAYSSDTLDTITTRGNTTANNIETGSVDATGDVDASNNITATARVTGAEVYQGAAQVLSIVTAPLVKAAATISIPRADATTNGYLHQDDFNAFSAKTDFGDFAATAPLTYDGAGTFGIPQATAIADGFLASGDWTLFDAKLDYGDLGASSPIVYDGAGAFSFDQSAQNTTNDARYLKLDASNDPLTGELEGTTFVGNTASGGSFTAEKAGAPRVDLTANTIFSTGGVTFHGTTTQTLLFGNDPTSARSIALPDASGTVAVGSTAPLVLNATTGNMSIPQANGSTDGFLSQADWTTFNSKEPAITGTTAADYYRGDKTFQTLDTDAVAEATNLYYTDARARAAISGSGNVTYDSGTGVIGLTEGAGSGLDADTVDTLQAAQFLRADAADTATGEIDFTGGIEADAIQDLAGNARLTLGASAPNVLATGNFQSDNFRTKRGAVTNTVIGESGVGNGASMTGSNNIIVGTNNSGGSIVGASLNVLIGNGNGINLTSGDENVAIGPNAGRSVTIGEANVMIGSSAGRTLTGGAVLGNRGNDNVFIGTDAGFAATDMEQGVFVGRYAGISATTGIANVFVGESAGYNVTTGEDNVFVGSDAGSSFENTGGVTTGDHNTAIGNNAGSTTTGGLPGVGTTIDQTGSHNSALGHATDWGGVGDYRTAIGAATQNTADNQIALGRAAGTDTVWVPGDLEVDGTVTTTQFRLNLASSSDTFESHIDGGLSSHVFAAHSSAASTDRAILDFYRSRGTEASPSLVSNDDWAGSILWRAYDGSTYRVVAEVSSEIDGTTGANDIPTRLLFKVSPDGSASRAEAARISNDKRLELSGGFKLTRATGSSGSISANVSIFGVTGSGARSITLPSAATMKAGGVLIIQDEAGNAGSGTITINRAGSDTINGATSVTITTNYGRRTLYSNGIGAWYSE